MSIERISLEAKATGVSVFSKVYGGLAAGAIGDTIGAPLEGYGHYKIIEENHGVVVDPLNVEQIGTDDTVFTEVLVRAYLEKGGRIGPEEFFDSWRRHNFLPEVAQFYCLRNAYDLVQSGLPPRVAGVGNIVTGSAVMCVMPVGIFNAGDPQTAYNDAKAIAYVHQRGLDVEVAGIYAACVAEAMRPKATLDSILETALRFAPRETMLTFDKRDPDNIHDTLVNALTIASRYDDPLASREELYAKVLQYHQLDPLEVLTLVLAVFKMCRGDVERAIVGGANMGRDADTIAGLSGALAGTLSGVETIPTRWMRFLKQGSENSLECAAHKVCQALERRERRTEERVASLLSASRRMVLEDKIFGGLIGSAIGELLGRPLHPASHEDTRANFGLVTDILDVEIPAYLRTFSNLTEVETESLMIQHILCRLYRRKAGRINNEDFAQALLSEQWPPDIQSRLSLFVTNVIELLREGMNSRLTGLFNVPYCVALTSCLPVAVYNAGDPNGAYIDTLDIFSCLQRAMALDCAAVYAAAVADAFSPNATVDSVLQTALESAPVTNYANFDPRLKSNLQLELKLALDIASKYDDVLRMRDEFRESFVSRFFFRCPLVDAVDALGIALAIFKVSKGEPEKALTGAANFGIGPSVVGNVVGGLCGAFAGGSRLPKRWVSAVNGREGIDYTGMAKDFAGLLNVELSAPAAATTGVELEDIVVSAH